MRGARICAATVLTLALAGCGDGSDPEGGPDSPGPSPTSEPTDASTQDPTGSPAPSGGTPEEPVVAEAQPGLMTWERVPGSVETTVVRGGPWSLSFPPDGHAARLQGPGATTIQAPERYRVTDAFLDSTHAVVVSQDSLEQRPAVADVVDLATGEQSRVDGRSDVPTTTGGTWALGEGLLLHASIGPARAYCLATVELASGRSQADWCAPKRHGFTSARITPAGTALMTFDDQQPSCRTVAAVEGASLTPFPGLPDCTAWEGLVLPDDGAVWSTIPSERRIEEARFHARIGDGYFDLGAGTSGTLTWCGGAAYFVRDPQADDDRARLLRWSPGGALDIVYESEGRGQAFLSEPRCGGDQITVTAFARSGDEQVTAPTG